jgi:1-pyrroline-5-carboxylate dehydrogenase
MLYQIPVAQNEPVLSYGPGTPERAALKAALKAAKSVELDIPMIIGGKEVRTNDKKRIHPPHEIAHTLGYFHKGDASHMKAAIQAALDAKESWEFTSIHDRAAIFLKAADLLTTKYRYKMNAATMLGQSKNAFQAEIDSACEFIDFLRFNVQFMYEMYEMQPKSGPGVWNRLEYRPLEGFILAVTPFNFTAIGGNLPTSAALLGNTVVWKCANTQIYSANVIMELLKEAGLPDGVINLVFVDGATVGNESFSHPEFAGIHFTGSSSTFNNMWKVIGENIGTYKSYPRIVGETGGKDFIMVHSSAQVEVVATALSRGAFEYQGQKCSAASRAYLPSNLASEIKSRLIADIQSFKMGSTEDFSNFINAVIDEKAFDSIAAYIDNAKKDPSCKILVGGNYDKSVGFFIEPTVIETTNPKYTTMCEEIFGPVLTLYVYDENKYEETLAILNDSSPYALTGAIIAQDRAAIDQAFNKLRHAAGNFYINDKPSGAVVGQQPFGGARKSGTNDKAGSILNLFRWVSARTIKETFNPPTNYTYPFLNEA